MPKRDPSGNDRLHAEWKKCPQCGQPTAITTEESPESREVHYTCPACGPVVTISTNLEERKAKNAGT